MTDYEIAHLRILCLQVVSIPQYPLKENDVRWQQAEKVFEWAIKNSGKQKKVNP